MSSPSPSPSSDWPPASGADSVRKNSAPARKPLGWRAWVLRLTDALDALLDIGVTLACIVADRTVEKLNATERTPAPPGRRDGVAAAALFWCRIAMLMKRTALLCAWLEEGNLPPRPGALPPAPPPRPAAAERAPGGSTAPGVPGGGAPREGGRRGGDGWYARMRADFARRPMEEMLARLHRTLAEAVRRADRPEAMGRIEALLARVRRLLAVMPKVVGAQAVSAYAARTDAAEMREAGWAPSMDGAAFCG